MRKSTLAALVAVSILSGGLAAFAQVPGVNSTLQSVFTLVYDASTMKPTYSAVSGAFTGASSTADVCSISGSATKTIKVRRIFVTLQGAAAAVTEPIAIVKRSTAYTAGAGGTMPQVAYDANNSAGTIGLAEYWTSNPTSGTVVGAISDILFNIGIFTGVGHVATFDYGTLGSPVVLRGVAQNLAVNFNGNTISGTINCTFEWTEDSDS